MTQQTTQSEQIIFNEPLQDIHVRGDEKLYLNDIETSPYHPRQSPQQKDVVPASSPELSEKTKSEESAAIRTLLNELIESVQTVDQRRQQSLLEMQQVALELAVAAASHLVQTVIEEDHFGIEELVQSVFESANADSSMSFTLNPEDLDLLNRRLAVTTAHAELRQVNFSTDASLARGSFRIQAGDGQTWLSTISLRLGEIRKHWLEELDAAQVERRETETTTSSLRRFPDRREIA